jgi:hypothetical protein
MRKVHVTNAQDGRTYLGENVVLVDFNIDTIAG